MESKFKFLTKYSLNKKLKAKSFLIGNVIVAIIIIALVNIDTIIKVFGGDFNSDTNIKIVDNIGLYEEVKEPLKITIESFSESKVNIKKVNDLEKEKKKIKGKKDIILVIDEDKDNVFKVKFISDSYVDLVKYQSVVSSLNSVKQSIFLNNYGIDNERLAKLSKQVEVDRIFLDKEKTEDEENSKNILSIASLIIVLPCFLLIVFLVQMIGAEINEEKSTRGMEIIIGNVSVKTHFFSKILASNLFVLIQSIMLLLYSGIGLIIRKITTTSKISNIDLSSSGIDINEITSMINKSGIINRLSYLLPLIIILILLSFLAYSLLAGILASMTTNMENFQQLQTPLMVISVIGYYLIIISSMFPGASFIKVMSVVPLISISLAPSLLLSGEITVTYLIAGIILLGLLNYLLIKYGLKIYKEGILNYQETNLWKKMVKALKS